MSLDKVQVEPVGSKGSVLKDIGGGGGGTCIGGKYFHDREAGESLLYLKNSEEASAIGTHRLKEEVDMKDHLILFWVRRGVM